MAAGDGADFLHWKGSGSPKRVLYIEGEMSRRQIKNRVIDAVRRHRNAPPNVFILTREEYPEMPPPDTLEGQTFINDFIDRIGGVDLLFFDRIMSLLKGDDKFGEDSWKKTLPWIYDLTRREIGQVWVHHTGHKEDHGYGAKFREWHLDAVLMLIRTVIPDDSELAFNVTFTKARDQGPDNTRDFASFLAYFNQDKWCSSEAAKAAAEDETAKGQCLQILNDTIKSDGCIQQVLVSDTLCILKTLWTERYRAAVMTATSKEDSIDRVWRRYAPALIKEGKVSEGKIGNQAWVWIPVLTGRTSGQPDNP